MARTVAGVAHQGDERMERLGRAVRTTRAARSMTCGSLYFCDVLLERLAQDLEPMPATLRPCIQAEDAGVRPRHLARQRHLAPADPPDIRGGVMRGATRTGRDQGGAVAGEARDAVEARGLKGFSEGHGRQHGGEPPCQQQLALPRQAHK